MDAYSEHLCRQLNSVFEQLGYQLLRCHSVSCQQVTLC